MKTTKNNLKHIMLLAWQMVKLNGYTMAEALKTAWRNFKLVRAMQGKIVKFYYTKVDGTIREAYGTLKESMLPATNGDDRRANETLQTYWDSERRAWRCFKKANLLRIDIA